jgi:hypothetical protein
MCGACIKSVVIGNYDTQAESRVVAERKVHVGQRCVVRRCEGDGG